MVVFSVVLAIPVVRGLFMLRTPKAEPPAGITVTVSEAQEPALWEAMRDVARQVGTRAPDEIVLIEHVNAAVSEGSSLLGLRPGARRLYLGLPLIMGLDEMQLRAVLAHEMGHYANFDTLLTPLIARGRAQLIRTVAHFHERSDNKQAKERERQEKKAAKRVAKGKKTLMVDTPGRGATYRGMAKIYTAYGNFYMRATLTTSRRQELATDLASVRVAGRDSAASALREVNALGSAHVLHELVRHPRRQRWSAAPARRGLRRPAPASRRPLGRVGGAAPGAVDRARLPVRLPPLARREGGPDRGPARRRPRPTGSAARAGAAGRPGRGAGRAGAGRPHPGGAGVQAGGLGGPGPRVDDLVRRPGHGGHPRGPLHQGAGPDLQALLDAIDADPAVRWRIADQFPKSEQAAAATGSAAREFSRLALRRALNQLVTIEPTARGAARWQLSWSDSATLRYPADGFEDQLGLALDAAVADQPHTESLRKLVLAP
ncbi:M48 family metallopeptidase [Streptomyces triculaminicus]|uniref:M48 family metallopeptidase n=1 Tax=Streptomyces triculaminicus TaxID=2816232 RepID=UPI0037D4297E